MFVWTASSGLLFDAYPGTDRCRRLRRSRKRVATTARQQAPCLRRTWCYCAIQAKLSLSPKHPGGVKPSAGGADVYIAPTTQTASLRRVNTMAAAGPRQQALLANPPLPGPFGRPPGRPERFYARSSTVLKLTIGRTCGRGTSHRPSVQPLRCVTEASPSAFRACKIVQWSEHAIDAVVQHLAPRHASRIVIFLSHWSRARACGWLRVLPNGVCVTDRGDPLELPKSAGLV